MDAAAGWQPIDRTLKLMIPGPVQPEDAVLRAMGGPVQAHYGPAWRDLYNETLGMLKPVFGTAGDVFLLVGSGSSAIDACIGSALATGEKILVGHNGYFGERLADIAANYGLEVVLVAGEWGRALDPQDFADALRRHPDARGVAVVYLETSTTVVNPIPEIGAVVRRHGLPFIVDAVSALGGLPMEMDAWGVDLCASASQKCLGAPPGLGPVAVGPRGWEAIDRYPTTAHGWYLNLRVWRRYAIDWADWHPHPITMATNNIVALRTSLQSLLAEGIATRMERYRRLALRLRGGLRRIGMEPYTPDDELAPVVTGAYGPPGVPTGDIVQYVADVHRIKIAGGLGALHDKIFRIGHMSPTVTEADIDEVLAALGAYTPEWHAVGG